MVTLAIPHEAGPCARTLACRDTLPVTVASPNLAPATEAGFTPWSTPTFLRARPVESGVHLPTPSAFWMTDMGTTVCSGN